MSSAEDIRFDRARLLKGGGAILVVASFPALTFDAVDANSAVAAAAGPYPRVDPTKLSTWLAIRADGTVVARSGHVELGNGNRTSLAQIVAEELDIPFHRVELVLGDSARTPNQWVTAASTTTRLAGSHLRQAAAEGRRVLLEQASKTLRLPVSALSVKGGVVSNASGSKTATYQQLVQGRVLTSPLKVAGSGTLTMTVSSPAKPKAPSTYEIVGKRIARVDIPAKVAGTATFVQDVVVPGMLHARVVHPPTVGSRLVAVEGFSPRVHGARFVSRGNLVAVVADDEYTAIQGAMALKVRWTDWKGLTPSTEADRGIRAMKVVKERTFPSTGNVPKALAGAAMRLSATYTTPFENHGQLGPGCSIASVRADGTVTVWSQTQWPQGLQQHIASILGISLDKVEVIAVDGSGSYGRNSSSFDDPGSEAAIISKLVGKPVRLQWMRTDEHRWEAHGPGTVQELRGGLDASGNLVAWRSRFWLPSISDNTELGAVLTGNLLGGTGIGIALYEIPYSLPNTQQVAHELGEYGAETSPLHIGIRTSFMRSPGQYQLLFGAESFVDELAAAARMDPLEFRIRSLKDGRAIAVLKAAAKAAGWDARHSPRKQAHLRTGTLSGRGIAYAERDGTHVAAVAEVTVDGRSGATRVTHVTVAHDCGLIINPIGVEHQIESCVIQTTSRAMLEELTFDRSNVTSSDWASYPILTMADSPAVSIVLIDRPDQPATGAGEATVNVVAPAVGNAIFDATGVRFRTLPLRQQRIKEGLA